MKAWKVMIIIAAMMALFFMMQFLSIANYGLDGGGNMMFMMRTFMGGERL